jgi:hypothetical protein
MWRMIKHWLCRFGAFLWMRFSGEKTYIVFTHKECGSPCVEVADFRGFGPEYQCFGCNALVPESAVSFRVVSGEEAMKLQEKGERLAQLDNPEHYLKKASLLHVLA